MISSLARINLGRARLLAGDPAGAIEAWRRGAELNRFIEWGRRCREAADKADAGEVVPFES